MFVMWLHAKTREILGPLLEEIRRLGAPGLQGIERGDMTEIALRDAAVVDLDVLGQGRGQFGDTGEACLRDDLGDVGVDALDQAVGLRMEGWAQPVLDGRGAAAHVEVKLAAWGCATCAGSGR